MEQESPKEVKKSVMVATIIIILGVLAVAGGCWIYYHYKWNAVGGSGVSVAEKSKLDLSVKFATIEEYVDYILDPVSGSRHKTVKPAVSFERMKVEGLTEETEEGEEMEVEEYLDVAPDGVSADVYVLAKAGWDKAGANPMQKFYFEVVNPAECWEEPDCEETGSTDYFGPFEGKLQEMVE